MGLKISSKRFVLSDQTKNLLGFVTLTAGIDLSAFQDNPVMLYNHDYEKLIGQWSGYRVEGTKLTAAPAFDESDPFAMQQYQKVEDGILKGCSVGLSPVKFNKDKEELSACILLEASLTPVPNNRSALAIYNAAGKKLSGAEVKTYLLSVERSDNPNTNETMDKKIITALFALCVQAGHTISLSADSTPEDIEGAIKKVGEKLTGLSADKVSLTAKVATLEADANAAAEKEITDAVTEAVEAKLLSADQAPAMIAFGKVNLSAFKGVIASLKPVSLVAVPRAKATAEPAGREAWGWDEYSLNAPNELEMMEHANPEKYKLLLSAKTAQARQKFAIEA